ncbi:hypothetical protein PV326_012416, partial [Microctonus aethiopoides]
LAFTGSRSMRKEVGPSEYPILVPTAPLTQLSPDAGPTIIQHEAVTMYNSVNKKVKDVIDYLHEALLAYTKGGLKLLKKRYHELPLILGGDFNIQFDTDEELRCVQFLKKELNLDFVFGNTLGTSRYGTSCNVLPSDCRMTDTLGNYILPLTLSRLPGTRTIFSAKRCERVQKRGHRSLVPIDSAKCAAPGVRKLSDISVGLPPGDTKKAEERVACAPQLGNDSAV